MAKKVDLLTLGDNYTVEDCKLASSFSHNRIIIACYSVQLVFCLISYAALYYLFKSAEFKRFKHLLSLNFKMLVLAGWFIYLAGLLVTTALYSYTLIFSLLHLSDCSYIWKAWACITFRFINHYSIIGLGIFHVMLLCERVHSIHRSSDIKNWAGYTFTTAALVLPIPVIIFMYHRENLVDVYKIYCFASKETIAVITSATHVIGIVDMFAMIGDIILYRYNKYLMKMKIQQNYSLTKSFQLRERELSIQLIIPLSILHTVAFVPFVVIYLMNEFFSGEERIEYLELAFLIKSFYNMFIPLALIYLQSRRTQDNSVEWLQNTANHAETYFRQLNAQFQRTP